MRAAALVLAGGMSSRLGQPKQLLDLGGAPLIARTVSNVAAAAVAEVVVVTGAHRERVEQALAGLPGGGGGAPGERPPAPVRLVHNPDYAGGMSTSLRAGLGALGAEVEVAVICLGDQPFVGPAIIDRLLQAMAESGQDIAVPVYAGQRGNPVAFRRRLFAELVQVTGDAGGRALLSAHPDQVVTVAFADDRAALDVDTPADYTRARERARP